MKEKITITKKDLLMACANVTVKACEEIGKMSGGQPDIMTPLYCTAFTVMLDKELFGEEETNGTAE